MALFCSGQTSQKSPISLEFNFHQREAKSRSLSTKKHLLKSDPDPERQVFTGTGTVGKLGAKFVAIPTTFQAAGNSESDF